MDQGELMRLDLTRSHPRTRVGDAWVRFKARDTSVGRLYVPSFISWQGKARPGWRVRINRASGGPIQSYFSAADGQVLAALEQAWAFVLDQLLANSLKPITPRPPQTSLDTGVAGVRLGLAKIDDPRSLMLRVSQSLQSDRSHNEIFHSVGRDGIDESAFMVNYRKAIAARRYYEHLRQFHYRLPTPITRATDIPERFYPDTVPVPDLFHRTLDTWPDLMALPLVQPPASQHSAK